MRFRRHIVGIFCGMLAGLWSAQASAEQLRIENVRLAASAERTRIVLDLSAASEHNLFTLSNPNRVVVDLSDARFDQGPSNWPQAGGVVANIRGANRDDGSARLVLDLGSAVRPKSFLLPPSGDYGYRVVIDLESLDAAPTVVKSLPKQDAGRNVIVAIDPGHGGKDPGARGKGGLREKDAVLAIAKRLEGLIDAEPGMQAMLTRRDDSFVHLRERRKRAEAAGADLFISIHADAFSDRRVRGATIYALSRKGATDEAAELLAKRENESDLIGGVDIKDKDDVLAGVLVDLSQNASLDASMIVGDMFIGEMAQIGKMRKAKVQQAGFRVLKSPDIPSILVETAFISNPQDESNLRSVQYQRRLAQAMHDAVRQYFYSNPPYGTRVAALSKSERETRQHVIRRGDTLSEIAAQYRVSVARIRAANQLRGSNIRVGQVLTIPPAVES